MDPLYDERGSPPSYPVIVPNDQNFSGPRRRFTSGQGYPQTDIAAAPPVFYPKHKMVYTSKAPVPPPSLPAISAPAATGAWIPFGSLTNLLLAVVTAVSIATAIGVALSTVYWTSNVHMLQNENKALRALIDHLENQIQQINNTLPEGNGTTVFDSDWTIAHKNSPGRKFRWDAQNVTDGTEAIFYLPSTTDTIVTQSTSPTTFRENVFAIIGELDGRRAEFSLDLYTANTMHLYYLPGKNGILATIEDIKAVAGNTSVFLDSAFGLLGDPNTSIFSQFSNLLLQGSSNYTFYFPANISAGGYILVVTIAHQTLSNKVLDNTNTITIIDRNFVIQNSMGYEVLFDASLLTFNNSYTFPNDDMMFLGISNDTDGFIRPASHNIQFFVNYLYFVDGTDPTKKLQLNLANVGSSTTITWDVVDASMTVIGESGGQWVTESLGITGSSGTYNDILLQGTTAIDRFFRFQSGGALPYGTSGIALSAFDANNWFLFGDVNNGDDFVITYNNSLPVGNGELGYRALAIDATTKTLKIYQFGDDTIYEELDVSGLTAARTASFPDVDCNVLCTTATQTMSNKIIGDTNSLTLYDNAIKIKSSTSAGSNLLLSIPNWGDIDRTWAFPNIFSNVTFLGASNNGYVNYGQKLNFGDTYTQLYNLADGTKKGLFDLGKLSASTTRTWYLPDADCDLLGNTANQTISNKIIDASNSISVLYTDFVIEQSVGGFGLTFNISRFTASRVITVQNKNGVLATLEDIKEIAGNTSSFLDDDFTLLSHLDTTVRSQLSNNLLTTPNTTYIYFLPNVIGGAYLVATTGVQTISDKTLDDTNIVTLLSSNFALEQTAGGHTATFTTTDLTGNRAYGLPDASMTLVGRAGGQWATDSLGITGSSGTYNNILLQASTAVDRFFRFRGGGSSPDGNSGICLSSFDNNNWFLFANTNYGGDFVITYNSSLPVGNGELGYRALAIDHTTKNLKLYQFGDDSIYEQFDVSNLTAARTASFPDVDCNILCTTATQTISNKIIDKTNSITVYDSQLILAHPSLTDTASFVVSGPPSQHNTFQLPYSTDTSNRLLGLKSSGAVIPAGGDMIFSDFYLGIAHKFQASRMLKFDLSAQTVTTSLTLLTSNTADQNITFPNLSGTIALTTGVQTISDKIIDDTNSITVLYTDFVIEQSVGGFGLTFNISRFTASRVITIQNKNGVLATLEDIREIAGNTSSFLDDDFTLLSHLDTTVRSQLSNNLLTTPNTTYIYFLPNVIGGAYLVATTGVQTISDKTLDDTNSVTLLSSNFALEQTAGGHTARFTTTDLTGNRSYGLPDVSMVLIGRSGGSWSTTSLGMTGGTGTYNTIQLAGSSGIDRFFRFRSGGGGLNGFSGITLSAFDGANWSLFGDTNNGADFAITYNSSVPVGNDEVGYRVLAIDKTSKNLKLYQFGDDTIYEELDVSGLTAARTASFPDVDCNVLCTTATQTMSNKIIDDTNSLTLYDNAIKIKSSTSAGSNLLLSIPNWGGTNRTWAFPSIYQDATFLGAVSGGIVNYGQTLKFGDSHTELYSFADGTKGGFFDLSLLSTATIRTWYLPDADCDLLGNTANQTMSNKIIDDTNSITVYDNNFLLKSSVNTSSGIQFSVPNLGDSTYTWSFPQFLLSDFTFLGVTSSGYVNYGETLMFGSARFKLYDNTQPSSVLIFNLDNISPSTIRTVTAPDTDCTWLCTTASQTVTNKVITDPSNSVRATEIATNDTASVIIVPSASAVSTGDVLTATSETTAEWKPPTTVNLHQYSFMATMNGWNSGTGTGWKVIPFSITDGTRGSYQASSAYDNTTYTYTVPVDGYYQFAISHFDASHKGTSYTASIRITDGTTEYSRNTIYDNSGWSVDLYMESHTAPSVPLTAGTQITAQFQQNSGLNVVPATGGFFGGICVALA